MYETFTSKSSDICSLLQCLKYSSQKKENNFCVHLCHDFSASLFIVLQSHALSKITYRLMKTIGYFVLFLPYKYMLWLVIRWEPTTYMYVCMIKYYSKINSFISPCLEALHLFFQPQKSKCRLKLDYNDITCSYNR